MPMREDMRYNLNSTSISVDPYHRDILEPVDVVVRNFCSSLRYLGRVAIV